MTCNFFGGNKLIIIKDTNLKFYKKDVFRDVTNTDYILIIENDVDKRKAEYKELSKIVNVLEFKALNEKEMINYIYTTFKKYNLNLSMETAKYFVDVCGIDKTNNINEMKKIVIFLNEKDTITKEIIDKICSKTLSNKIFDLLDYSMYKNKSKAINLLNDLILQKTPIIQISNLLYKQIKNLYMIKVLKNRNTKNMNDILKIHPYVYNKLLTLSENFEEKHLKDIIYKFVDYDKESKLGEIDFEIGIKKIICFI
jgi:DNA polymerase III subunit delta